MPSKGVDRNLIKTGFVIVNLLYYNVGTDINVVSVVQYLCAIFAMEDKELIQAIGNTGYPKDAALSLTLDSFSLTSYHFPSPLYIHTGQSFPSSSVECLTLLLLFFPFNLE